MKKKIHNTFVEIKEADITAMHVDAIVNAANNMLKHGGGVAGMIVEKGGPVIQEESDVWVKAWGGHLNTGSAAITTGGKLPARYVIHAVGPRMGEGDEDRKLEQAALSCLSEAEKRHFKSIAFPAISTGIFGYPMHRCAQVMLTTVIQYVQKKTGLQKIIFCLRGSEALQIFQDTFVSLTK